MIDAWSLASAAGAGGLVGFSLGLIGGGGSILAVPLLLYFVGVPTAHVAIGTSSVAVALNALSGLAAHARMGNVRWRVAGAFAVVGATAAWFGSLVGKRVGGNALLLGFAVLMIVVAAAMLRRRATTDDESATRWPRLLSTAAGVGSLAGFFGIGGGFLIVPGLRLGGGLSERHAVGSSLLAVAAFGGATATSYALSGLVDWSLAAPFVVAGALGSYLGTRLSTRLSARKGLLTRIFAAAIVAAAAYIVLRVAL